MHISRSILLALPFAGAASAAAAAAAAPAITPAPEAPKAPVRRAGEAAEDVAKRQDFSELIEIASLAGIPIPTTNPALLLSLAPLAAELASNLPTAPILSVLETAIPSGFLSEIVHNPTSAEAFESSFAAAESPTWFLDLPSSVREYLHTYEGVPTVVSEVGSVIEEVSSATRTAGTVTLTGTGGTSSGGLASGVVSTEVTSATSSTGSGVVTVTTSVSATTTSGVGVSAGTTGPSSGSSGGGASSTSSGGAARETVGVWAAGCMAAAGVLGVAIAL